MPFKPSATKTVRAGINSEPLFGDVVAPVHLSTTFAFKEFAEVPEHDYTRASNPTRALLGRAIADLEGGYDAVVTASGMAAIAMVIEAFVPVGSLVVAPHDCYGGTWRLLDSYARKGRLQVEFLDLATPADIPPAALVIVESPSNPLLRLTDIAAVTAAAHAQGALVLADNTFATPMNCQPISLGVDLVVHSATKYLAGHSDVVLGAVVSARAELHEELAFWGKNIGVTAGPIDCYLGLRGLRTLHLRFPAAEANAQAIAADLRGQPEVQQVYYPGFGAIVSFELADTDAVRAFTDGLTTMSLAESLGGVETLIAHPATMTHSAMPDDVRAAAGITDGLLRLSVGIEDLGDLLADIHSGLARIGLR
ncbi:MAG: PLP-dependent transferase [Propionibacteriaceae bacterium]|jgi:cystathionine gamma-synthase|nr:PLP-dependent transferase [Propionibacteriaceae bacterium]